MKTILILFYLLLAPMLFTMSCAPAAVALPGYQGFILDVNSDTGEQFGWSDSSIIAIGAGHVRVGKQSFWHAWYLIDKAAETCWFKVGGAIQTIDCCSVLKVENAEKHLSFLKSTQCNNSEKSKDFPK